MAQVSAPVVHCASVNAAGDVLLTWAIPADPANQFFRYDVYGASVQTGPFSLVGSISTYSQNSYTHVGAGANVQSKYYYIVTLSSAGTVTSTPSDTLRSIFLNVNNPGNGIATLTWNSTRTPLLPSASTQYTVSREYPVGTWTTLYTGSNQIYKDTISICHVYYSYRVVTSDALGCTSQSNISGSLFSDFTSPRIPFLDSVSVNSNGSTSFGWNPSTSPDTYGYVIYKQFNGIWTPVDTVWGINNTSYTYTAATAGTNSENYCIAAFDSCKNISPLGAAHKTIYLSNTYDLCARAAKLSWNAYGNLPRGVLDYKVYCSVNGGTYNLIGTTNALSYTHGPLTPGDNYCYLVRVVNNTNDITSSSNKSCVLSTGANGPAYIYIRSVSVNVSQTVDINYIIDNTKPSKGVKLYRSPDGISFSLLAANTNTTNGSFTDTDVHCKSKNYYYKLVVMDTCGNDGAVSNVSKTILLRVSNDNTQIFYNNLVWDDYSSWLGGVASYNIYRAVDGVFDPVPVANVSVGNRGYSDDVSAFARAGGKFTYYVQALEGPGNTHGLQDSSRSNTADAYAEATVFVPDAFAPKGRNNVWLPIAQYVEKTDYKVTVFNRWGSKVFETASDTQGWDGSQAIDDVYAYLIQYKNARGEFIELKGTVTVLR